VGTTQHWRVELTVQGNLVPRLRMCGYIPPLSQLFTMVYNYAHDTRSVLSYTIYGSLLFCTLTNKSTIIAQIITLLHVSTLLCHRQTACNQYLAKLHQYFKRSCWQYNLQLKCSVLSVISNWIQRCRILAPVAWLYVSCCTKWLHLISLTSASCSAVVVDFRLLGLHYFLSAQDTK
jgi:hypothetical protein